MRTDHPPRSSNRFGRWSIPVLCVLLAIQIATSFGAGSRNDLSWFDPIVDVRQMVLDDFVGDTDPDRMQEAAISGMLETLDDPYTVWIPPRMEGEFDKQMRGSYVGIGAEIDIENDRLRIVSPLEDSPSLEAGVRAGDTVLSIEGTDTLGLGTEACIELLMGEEGTPVVIEVRHADGEEETIEIVRRRIETRSVKGVRRHGEGWDFMLDPAQGIGYVRLVQFTERSIEEMRAALDDLEAAGCRGLVLDLRFNGGGTLEGAIDIADLFLDRGVIVSVRDRDGRGRSWTADDDEDDLDQPMVILVNDGSASASEIVTGALQSHDRAKVLGERTFGKGSVQEVRVLPDQRGTLKITTARYHLPDGRNLDRHGDPDTWGVDPDPGYAIDLDPEAYGEIVTRRRRYEPIDSSTDREPASFDDPDWVEETLGDPQLAAAMRALSVRLEDGDWPRVGGDPSAALVARSELARQVAYRARLLDELASIETKIAELEVEADAGTVTEDDPATEDG